ncbi:MAG: Nif3-like dinuclear metal center hexameric protein [Clostridia bacterium]|nr:Nif3-like dinuclear metal center hexameric protein [Clostridia bacterium]
MNFRKVYDLIDDHAPFRLSEAYCQKNGAYDNSGVIAPLFGEVKGILFSLDLSVAAVDAAIREGCNVIVTHHPAIFHPIKSVDGAVLKAANSGIGVISAHLNLDVAERGIDFWFAEGLGAARQEILEKLSDTEGYGRRFFVGKSLKEIRMRAESVFDTTVLCYGHDDMHINTVASFCGAGLDDKNAETDCDLICSCDVSHHLIVKVVESGKALMIFTHYSCEKYGLMKLYEAFSSFEGFDQKVKLYYFDDKRLF